MTTNHARDYNCKDEELPALCTFTSFSLTLDLVDISDFSPRFNEQYKKEFEISIATAKEVVEPESETAEQKVITGRIKTTLDGLVDPINRLSGYIEYARPKLGMTAADFGIKHLRTSIVKKDAAPEQAGARYQDQDRKPLPGSFQSAATG